jgi:hypothetical protein
MTGLRKTMSKNSSSLLLTLVVVYVTLDLANVTLGLGYYTAIAALITSFKRTVSNNVGGEEMANVGGE